MEKNSRIYIAGHRGMVGSAITRLLEDEGFNNLIVRTHEELDLSDQMQVKNFFTEKKPDYVILAAARVGGIQANIDNPATFLLDNLLIQNNVIDPHIDQGSKNLYFWVVHAFIPKNVHSP